MKCLDILEAEEFLNPVRCQSHAISLLVKAVATKCFKTEIDKAGSLIEWVRGRPRIHSLLSAQSKLSIYRFIDVRFGSHVIACERLSKLRASLIIVVCDKEYKEYRDSQSSRVRDEYLNYERLIRENDAFWSRLDLFVTLCTPIIVALRFMDEANVRAVHVNRIWESLITRLSLELQTAEISLDEKKAIYRLALRACETSHKPIFDAAWVLDPSNRDVVNQLACGSNSDRAAEWERKSSNTLKVLKLMVRRNILMKFRMQQSKGPTAEPIDAEEPEREEDEASISLRKSLPARTCVSAETFLQDAEFLSKVQATEDAVTQEFYDYCGGLGKFASVKDSSESFWMKVHGDLRYFAICVLNTSATTSNVERMHKTYAGVHRAERSSMKGDRVDRLCLTRLHRLTTNQTPCFDIEKFQSFEKVSSGDATALQAWKESLVSVPAVASESATTEQGVAASSSTSASVSPQTEDDDADAEAQAVPLAELHRPEVVGLYAQYLR